jgi:hypothetical protein
VIVLERRLHYRPVATTDTVEAVVFYSGRSSRVALGMGVWGVAHAAVARAVAGTAVMLRAARSGSCARAGRRRRSGRWSGSARGSRWSGS